MFQTLIVYLLIYACSLVCAKQAQIATIGNSRSLSSTPIFYIGIIIFSLIVGLRWNVGIDFPVYYDLLMGYYSDEAQLTRLELIPYITILGIQKYDIPFYYWFVVMAFIQMFFLQKTFDKNLKIFLVWGIFFYLTSQLAYAMNIIRQAAAVSVVLYAYTFINSREYRKYLFWVFIASLFHLSALIGIPIMFLSRLKVSFSQIIQIVIVGLFFLFGDDIIDYVSKYIYRFSGTFEYLVRIENIYDEARQIKASTGLGVIFYYLRYIVLILYSKKLSKEYGKYGFDIFYTLSFVGICLYNATMYSMYLSRISMYFSICSVICLAMLMVYLWRQKHNTIHQLIVIGLTLVQSVLTLNAIINGYSWNFVWDSHLY